MDDLEPEAPSPPAPRPAVVLVRPQEQGNVGAVARAMANMGLSELLLVEPAVEVGEVARARAVHAAPLLASARRSPSLKEALAPFRFVAATTSGRGRLPKRPHFTARELAVELARDPRGPVAVVFGPEASGLDREELALASCLVTIPADAAFPTLNLSQAVQVVSYELYQARLGSSQLASERTEPAVAQAELEGLFAQLVPILERVGFARDVTFAGVLRELRALAARAQLTRRELTLLRGVCRRTAHALERSARGPSARE